MKKAKKAKGLPAKAKKPPKVIKRVGKLVKLAKSDGKPGPKPKREIVVKLDVVDLKLINRALKETTYAKQTWLVAALRQAAYVTLGDEPTGHHPVLKGEAYLLGEEPESEGEEEEIPDATEHVSEHAESEAAMSAPLPVVVQAPWPQIGRIAPAPTPPGYGTANGHAPDEDEELT